MNEELKLRGSTKEVRMTVEEAEMLHLICPSSISTDSYIK